MRVAIVHDALVQFGGAERVLLALMELFENAPVYTLLYNPDVLEVMRIQSTGFDADRIRPSFLQHIPGARRHHHYYPLLMPLAAEHFDFSGYDVVISDSYSYAKGIITDSRTLHLSYCFTPTRYVWDDCHSYVRDFSRLAVSLRLAPLGLSYIRLWDYYASQRVDDYVTISNFVAQRIKKYYGRESVVIVPPVDVDRFEVSREDDGYYLIVSRLVPYKRIDLAVQACERLGRRLLVVGSGPERKHLERLAGPNTKFLGFLPDSDLPRLYGRARALLFPQEEDFGITPLEAAACGTPTIALAAGGALETLVQGETGVLFFDQSVEGVVEAIIKFESMTFEADKIRTHAEGFSRDRFQEQFSSLVHDRWKVYQQTNLTRV